ncbi:caspase family protein [Nodosilinea sp. AN01ver1]|uniref:caspase family protein n=1 Tax=Nodosilinea sp. AN01ver1 TaxID=3423362 RepID=UPI003D324501
MTRFQRRRFLQFASAIGLAVGLGSLTPATRPSYAQAAPRKLALLIGIDEYTNPQIRPLRGCVTDVELQRRLLRDRYGFADTDILTLTNGEATREAILGAIAQHLVQQSQMGDVVVLHFSGHTTRDVIADGNCKSGDCWIGALLPTDAELWGEEFPPSAITRSDLEAALSPLATNNLTMVLDVLYGGSFASNGSGFAQERSFFKGVLLAASTVDQLSAEVRLEERYAGAFTHTLTQHLWQQSGTESFAEAMAAVIPATEALARENRIVQTPVLVTARADDAQQPIYFTAPLVPTETSPTTRPSARSVTRQNHC